MAAKVRGVLPTLFVPKRYASIVHVMIMFSWLHLMLGVVGICKSACVFPLMKFSEFTLDLELLMSYYIHHEPTRAPPMSDMCRTCNNQGRPDVLAVSTPACIAACPQHSGIVWAFIHNMKLVHALTLGTFCEGYDTPNRPSQRRGFLDLEVALGL